VNRSRTRTRDNRLLGDTFGQLRIADPQGLSEAPRARSKVSVICTS
jgi:hypothetical protein